jgi:hypothetical protein
LNIFTFQALLPKATTGGKNNHKKCYNKYLARVGITILSPLQWSPTIFEASNFTVLLSEMAEGKDIHIQRKAEEFQT